MAEVLERVSERALLDAEEFARVLAKNWEGGLLVARSAERAQGRRLLGKSQKLPISRFAEAADVDHKTVARYLDAWDAAAKDGLVPAAETLAPGDLVDLDHLDAKAWDGYYATGKTVAERIVASNENEWYTPARYIEAARAVLGTIDLDPASSLLANQTVRATTFYTSESDGLSLPWSGRVWLNPPYGRLAGDFVTCLVSAHGCGYVSAAITLVNAHCTDTDWFQQLWNYSLCFTDHRIDFDSAGRDKTSTSTHGSVFAYLGDDVAAFADHFAPFGPIVERIERNGKLTKPR